MIKDIQNSLKVLKKGGMILYPTDTIWGIGCDATNPEAVDQIFRIKKRSDTKSLLVLLDNPERLSDYVKEIPEIAWDLIKVSDQPLTIVYPHHLALVQISLQLFLIAYFSQSKLILSLSCNPRLRFRSLLSAGG